MLEQIFLDKERLKTFFIHHLDKIYAAKSHLLHHLPEILYQVHFSDLEEAIYETINMVERQKVRMREIYRLLGEPISEGASSGLSGLVDDSFTAINANHDDPELRDMSILFYFANIEGLEMASFQVLQLLSVRLKNKQIHDLITANFDDAQRDKTLMLLLVTKYAGTVG